MGGWEKIITTESRTAASVASNTSSIFLVSRKKGQKESAQLE